MDVFWPAATALGSLTCRWCSLQESILWVPSPTPTHTWATETKRVKGPEKGHDREPGQLIFTPFAAFRDLPP